MPSHREPPSILLVARPGPEADDLFADLSGREDLLVLRAANAAAAVRALRDLPVAVVVVSPETPRDEVEALLSGIHRARPGTPVLALRSRRDEEPPSWRERGVGILRMPLLPGVLSRSVDVVLGMTAGRRAGR